MGPNILVSPSCAGVRQVSPRLYSVVELPNFGFVETALLIAHFANGGIFGAGSAESIFRIEIYPVFEVVNNIKKLHPSGRLLRRVGRREAFMLKRCVLPQFGVSALGLSKLRYFWVFSARLRTWANGTHGVTQCLGRGNDTVCFAR